MAAASAALVWDSKRLFEVPGGLEGGLGVEGGTAVVDEALAAKEAAAAAGGEDIAEFDTVAAPGGVSAWWTGPELGLKPWPPAAEVSGAR